MLIEITDEMVEAAAQAVWDDNNKAPESSWPGAADWAKRSYRNRARLALEAAFKLIPIETQRPQPAEGWINVVG